MPEAELQFETHLDPETCWKKLGDAQAQGNASDSIPYDLRYTVSVVLDGDRFNLKYQDSDIVFLGGIVEKSDGAIIKGTFAHPGLGFRKFVCGFALFVCGLLFLSALIDIVTGSHIVKTKLPGRHYRNSTMQEVGFVLLFSPVIVAITFYAMRFPWLSRFFGQNDQDTQEALTRFIQVFFQSTPAP